MFKSFVLGLYASGHSLHVRVTQTFAVNRFRTGAIYSMHSKTTHRTSVFGNNRLRITPFLEIRCKSTAFHTKRSSKNEERAKNLLFVNDLMHFAKSDIGTFNRHCDVIVGM